MSNENCFKCVSTGGLGDAFVVFCKIYDRIFDGEETVVWEHFTGHEFHRESITDLMTRMPRIVHGKVNVMTAKEREPHLVELGGQGYQRLSTKANDGEHHMVVDRAHVLSGEYSDDWLYKDTPVEEPIPPHAVIQVAAGRDDASFRNFTPSVIYDLCKHFVLDRGMRPVLLGPKFDTPHLFCGKKHWLSALNRTGDTDVEEAMDIIASAKYFVGLDGFQAYVAMAFEIPTTVVFHDPRLPGHYMADHWKHRSTALVGPQRINQAAPLIESIGATIDKIEKAEGDWDA